MMWIMIFNYPLFQVCKQKIAIEPLDGNHRSILLGDTVKKIANILETKLIKA